MRGDDTELCIEHDAKRRAAGPGKRRPGEPHRFCLHEVRLAYMIHDVEVERDRQRARAGHPGKHADNLAGERIGDEEGRAEDQKAYADRVDPAARQPQDQQRQGQRDRQAGKRYHGVEQRHRLLALQEMIGLDRYDAGNRGTRERVQRIEHGEGACAGTADGGKPDRMPDLRRHSPFPPCTGFSPEICSGRRRAISRKPTRKCRKIRRLDAG